MNSMPAPPDPSTPSRQELDRLLGGAHHDPHGLLGVHTVGDDVVVRVLRPHATGVEVVYGDKSVPAVAPFATGCSPGRCPTTPATTACEVDLRRPQLDRRRPVPLAAHGR